MWNLRVAQKDFTERAFEREANNEERYFPGTLHFALCSLIKDEVN